MNIADVSIILYVKVFVFVAAAVMSVWSLFWRGHLTATEMKVKHIISMFSSETQSKFTGSLGQMFCYVGHVAKTCLCAISAKKDGCFNIMISVVN